MCKQHFRALTQRRRLRHTRAAQHPPGAWPHSPGMAWGSACPVPSCPILSCPVLGRDKVHTPHSFRPCQRGWHCPQSPVVANALGVLTWAGAPLHAGQRDHIPCAIPRLLGAQGRGDAAASGGAVRFTPFSVVYYLCLEAQVLHWEKEEEISPHPTKHKGLAAREGGACARWVHSSSGPPSFWGRRFRLLKGPSRGAGDNLRSVSLGSSSRHLRFQPCWALGRGGPEAGGGRLEGGGWRRGWVEDSTTVWHSIPPAAGTRTGTAPGPPPARDPRCPQPCPWARPWLRPPPSPCLSFPLRSALRPSAWPRAAGVAWHGMGKGQHPQRHPREHPQPAAPGHSPRASCQLSRCARTARGWEQQQGQDGLGAETPGVLGRHHVA